MANEKLFLYLIAGWRRGSLSRYLIIAGAIITAAYLVIILFKALSIIDSPFDNFGYVFVIPAASLFYAVLTYERLLENKEFQEKIESFAQKVRDNPGETQLAWELAQAKLESYLNRNLAQVRSIYWLTIFVMVVGFGFILFGLYRAFDSPERLPVAVVASVSGILISFIGGSFLLVYKSTLGQSKEFVSVLERINAVGMAVQILETIPDEKSDLRYTTTSELAKQLLNMYSDKPRVSTGTKAGEAQEN